MIQDQSQGRRGPRGRRSRDASDMDSEHSGSDIEEYILRINRCSKVVKGGRRLSFSAVVVVGDHKGRVGFGLGKANEVADAIRKGGEVARKRMVSLTIAGDTIPHDVIGRFSGAEVLLRPAAPGTGVIAGGGVRAIMSLAGVRNVLSKSLGSNNKLNVVYATLDALQQLRTKEQSDRLRGLAS